MIFNDYPVDISLEELNQLQPSQRKSNLTGEKNKFFCARCGSRFGYRFSNPEKQEGIILENECKYHTRRPITEGKTTNTNFF